MARAVNETSTLTKVVVVILVAVATWCIVKRNTAKCSKKVVIVICPKCHKQKCHCSKNSISPANTIKKSAPCGSVIGQNQVPAAANRAEYNFDPTRIMPKMCNDGDDWGRKIDLSAENFLNAKQESYTPALLVSNKNWGIQDIRGVPASFNSSPQADNIFGGLLRSGTTANDLKYNRGTNLL